MFVRAGAQTAISKLAIRFARLIPDRRGVAAVEFALIAPLLLSMYFVTVEVALGIEANRKVGRVGSMVADLITQNSEVTPSQLDAIMKIGESIMQPYNRSTPTIVMTAIEITPDPASRVEVAWSRKMGDNVNCEDAAAGTLTTVPPTLNIPGSFLIRVESCLKYKPLIIWSKEAKPALGLMAAFDNLDMKETYYLRPRISPTVKCETC
jgi:Flp pilus assembly protein TadG